MLVFPGADPPTPAIEGDVWGLGEGSDIKRQTLLGKQLVGGAEPLWVLNRVSNGSVMMLPGSWGQ